MSEQVVLGARRLAWDRRRRSLARGWAGYRRSTQGMVGLGVLTLIVLAAIFAPLLASEDNLSPVNTVDNPTWASPSE
ncbi:MAG: ABC transporter permease, partial [Actinobacteria bacterium]|nr:ABC transporter permease [Actinomycetota bacterium]